MFSKRRCAWYGSVSGMALAFAIGSINVTGQAKQVLSVVELRDGRSVQGELQGRIVLASPPPARILVVLNGTDVSAVNAAGVEIGKNAVVTRVGLPQTSPEAVWKMSNEQMLSAALAIAERKQPGEVPFNLRLEAVLSGKVDGPGTGSIAVPGGFIYFFREVNGVIPNNFVLLGELQVGREGASAIAPTLRLRDAGGVRPLAVDSLRTADLKK